MEYTDGQLMLNDVLVEAAKLPPDERRARIKKCLAQGRHAPEDLARCVEPSRQELVRFCDHCWSVIDPHGLTWSWPPSQPISA